MKSRLDHKLNVPTILFLISILFIGFTSCERTRESKMVEEKLESEEPFRIGNLYDQIKEHLNSPEEHKFDPKLRFTDTLRHFYKDRRYHPLWTSLLVTDSIHDEFLKFISSRALEEGLHPEFYHVKEIEERLNEMPSLQGDDRYIRMAELELLISDNLLSLHSDHVIGRVDPNVLYGSFYNLPLDPHEDFGLMDILDPENYQEEFDSATLTDSNYVRYKELLAHYRALQESDSTWETVDTTGITKLVPGDPTTILPGIAKKLLQLGVISEREAQRADPSVYNRRFLPIIRKAQQYYNLHDDGVIGIKTLQFINETFADRIESLMANMERVRWVRMPEQRPYVFVNIPEFTLYMYYPHDSTKTMKVCVGKPRPRGFDAQMKKYEETKRWFDRPKDHETPQIYSKIEYFVLNPTWTVPNSIVAREMYWQMRKDSSYLRKGGYKIYYRGEEMNPDTIDWSKYKANKVPFKFVQNPGEGNALGQIKYIFRNPFFIYLHDTPQKDKFEWSRRAVSHGCVRLEKPLDFGEFVLYRKPKMNYDDFRITLGHLPLDSMRLEEYDPEDTTLEIRPIDTTRIEYLDTSIQIYFLYRTVYFTPDGPRFVNDVYDKNSLLINAMKEGDRLRIIRMTEK